MCQKDNQIPPKTGPDSLGAATSSTLGTLIPGAVPGRGKPMLGLDVTLMESPSSAYHEGDTMNLFLLAGDHKQTGFVSFRSYDALHSWLICVVAPYTGVAPVGETSIIL
ncbi:uncharacterized protein N7482_004966 [Penicillium canariense]|uniref:Uncharacterized protein n=1 Tax=Penicillium canariense TaxID=189055 RepID=A0A9W9I1G8_9EURO|nr:uncharacterized protein N7482_004966 [Penicillium canariense]KAJ5166185.1 hypothetical protein N7482_004966 [Penicillium canariense]